MDNKLNLSLNLNSKGLANVAKPFQKLIGTSNRLSKSLEKNGSQLKKLQSAKRNIDQFKQLKNTSKQLASQLNAQQEKTRQLKQELINTKNPTQKLRNEFLKSKAASEKTHQSYQLQRKKLFGLSQSLKTAGINTRNLSSEEASLSSNIANVNAKMGKQAALLNKIKHRQQAALRIKKRFDQGMQRNTNIAASGAAGFASGSRGLGGIAAIVQPGISFEEQMSKVGALSRVNKNSAAFKKLEAQAKSLGASTHFSATQAAQGQQFLAMAGFEVNETIAAMPGLLSLAKAGGTELGETSDIASNILSGFNIEATQMGMVSDVLAATFTRSNVDLRMLGETMKYVAPIANKFGASLQETSALAGLLGNVGIQGSMAGTSMRRMYQNISSHKPAQKALAALGINARDTMGNMRAMPLILAEVAKATEKMGSGQRLTIFKEIAGMQAGAAFAALIDQGGAGEITKFIDILHNSGGEAQRIAKQMGDNTAGDIIELKSAFEGLNISIASTNTSPLRKLIQSTTGIVRSINQWVKDNPKLAGQLIKIAAVGSALLVGFGGLAITLAGIMGPFLILKFAAASLGLKLFSLVGGIKMVGTAVAILGKALLLNPIGLAITSIALAAYLIYKNWQPLKAFFTDLWQSITQKTKTALQFFIKLPLQFVSIGASIVDGLLNGIKNKFSQLQNGIINIAKAITGKFKKLLGINSPSRVFMQYGQNISDGLGNGIQKNANNAFKNIKAVAATLPVVATTATPIAAKPLTQANKAPIKVEINYGDIHIHGAKNNDDIIKLLHDTLNQREAQAAARLRSAIYDHE